MCIFALTSAKPFRLVAVARDPLTDVTRLHFFEVASAALFSKYYISPRHEVKSSARLALTIAFSLAVARDRSTRHVVRSPNQVLSRHCGRACSTSQEKHLFMNPHGKVRARGILNNPLTNWHHDSWCRWAHLYSPYFRLRRSRATASERAMVRAT